jgi:pimeloyl-ACP methyl ester carboxylesterase
MRQVLCAFLFLHFLCVTAMVCANPPEHGAVERIATRVGVQVPIYAVWKPDAVATVVLLSGGAGGYGRIGEDGWPSGGNFLIRTGRRWANHPFNVVMVGRPSDGIDLAAGWVRTGGLHGEDNGAIFKAVKQRSPLPLWVIGTSMGTISAAAAAIRDDDGLVAGVVMTSTILAYKLPGAVPTQDLAKIRVPVLLFHHEHDACWACRADELRFVSDKLTNAPVVKTLLVSGGDGATGNPCEPDHHHGFVGMREDAVDRIAAWILAPGR